MLPRQSTAGTSDFLIFLCGHVLRRPMAWGTDGCAAQNGLQQTVSSRGGGPPTPHSYGDISSNRDHLSVTLSVGTPLYPYGISWGYGLSTSWLIKKTSVVRCVEWSSVSKLLLCPRPRSSRGIAPKTFGVMEILFCFEFVLAFRRSPLSTFFYVGAHPCS
jgi:hypothetical protein